VSAVSCPSTTACWAVGQTATDFAILTELGVTVTPTTTLPPPVTVPSGGATPYELYCPGTPVGNIVLNDVVTTAALSPASPTSGSQFTVVNYQTQVTLPASIVGAAAALGNSAIAGSATADVNATGATPASISTGAMSFSATIPSPVPSTGLELVIPPAASTVGPFTASGGPITITEGSQAHLSILISGSKLNLTCTGYPNDSAPTGIAVTGPVANPESPTIATSSASGPTTTVASSTTTVTVPSGTSTTLAGTPNPASTTTVAPTTTAASTTTTTGDPATTTTGDPATTTTTGDPAITTTGDPATTVAPTTTAGATQAAAGSTTTVQPATAANGATTSDPPGVVSVPSSALAFTGPGSGVESIGVVGVVLMVVGLALLSLTDVPRYARRRLAMVRAAWDGEAPGSAPSPGRRGAAALSGVPAAAGRAGRSLAGEAGRAVRWLVGR